MRYFKIYFIHGMCNIVNKKNHSHLASCTALYLAILLWEGNLQKKGDLKYKAPARGSIERLIQGQQVHNGNHYLQLYYGEV